MSRPVQIFLLEPSTSVTSMIPLTSQSGMISSHNPNDLQMTSSQCRICASNTKLVLPIFEKEGLENNLADKIQKYLPIQVSQDDMLPKVVCFQCTTTILTWHELVTTCQQADTTLRSQVPLGLVDNVSKQTQSDNISESTVSFIESVKEVILKTFKNVTMEENCGIEFVCDKCNNQRFCYIEDLSDHLVSRHIPETSSRTTIQTFIKNHIKFQKGQNLSNHNDVYKPARRKLNSDTTYSCKLCKGRFTSTTRLIGHLHEHVALDFEAGVPCCGCVYSEREALTLHVRADHRAAHRAAACRSCGHEARDAAALRAHVLADHGARRPTRRQLGLTNQKRIPAACPLCGKTFSNKYNMAVHARSHAAEPGQSRHACDTCGRHYSTRGNLAAHARAAHAAPARACPACGERFARAGDLRRHEALHAPPALRCADCPAAFHHADSLRRHRLAHRDSRPHACPRCRRAFRQHSHLAAHRASHVCRLLQDGR